MSHLTVEHVHEVDSCLRQWGIIVSHSADAFWEMTLRNASASTIHVRLIEDWLQIDAKIGSPVRNSNIWSMLRWNGLLEGAAKFALNISDGSMAVQAEIPLDREAAVAPDLDATLSGFERASILVHDDSGCEANIQSRAVSIPSRQKPPLVVHELLADAAWSYVERPGGIFVVDLESKGDFRQALIEVRADGSLRASVELARWESQVPVSCNALALLLLMASGAIRMVRPMVENRGNEIDARFEIRLSSNANSALLGRGLAALSVACRHCGREAVILNNERIAEQYLAVRGFITE